MNPVSLEALMDDLSQATGQVVSFVNARGTNVVVRGAKPNALPCAECERHLMQQGCTWLPESDRNAEMLFCPSGALFFQAPLGTADHVFGTLAIGPLPPTNRSWLMSMRTMLYACACLARESRLFPEHESLFEMLKCYIQTHIAEPLDCQTLSSVFYLSSDTLSRATLRHAGLPLRHFIQAQRLEHARGLLMGTRLRIQEIASRCGFDDYNYFSRAFRKQYGCTPSGMRAGTGNTSPEKTKGSSGH